MWTLSTPSEPSDDEIDIDIVYIDYGASAAQYPATPTSHPAPNTDQHPSTGMAETWSVCWPQCMGIPNKA